MKKLLITCFVVIVGFQTASAQGRSEAQAEIRDLRNTLLKERQNQTRSTAAVSGQVVTAADVGEPDSFGKNALFLGIAQSGIVIVDPDCSTITGLGPDDRCLSVPDTTINTTATFNDIARITIPGKSVNNIIYAIANHTVSADMFNPTSNPVTGRMNYSPSVTIESEALNDPTLIDPTTGLPFGGKYTTTGVGTQNTIKTLAPGAVDFTNRSYSRANTLGFSRTFFAGLGLPTAVIDQIYKKPVTIRLNVTVTARWVDSGVMSYSIRFLGN